MAELDLNQVPPSSTKLNFTVDKNNKEYINNKLKAINNTTGSKREHLDFQKANQQDYIIEALRENQQKLVTFVQMRKESGTPLEIAQNEIKLQAAKISQIQYDSQKVLKKEFFNKLNMKEQGESIMKALDHFELIDDTISANISVLNNKIKHAITSNSSRLNDSLENDYNQEDPMIMTDQEGFIKAYYPEDAMDRYNNLINKITRHCSKPLFDVVDNFRSNTSKKVLLIQGHAGTGKTTFLQNLERKLWREYYGLEKNNTNDVVRIPLRIVLSETRDYRIAIEEFWKLNDNALKTVRNEPVMIMFDGFDEIDKQINLYEYNHLGDKRTWYDAKVIVTSRKENLPSTEGFEKWFVPNNDLSVIETYCLRTVSQLPFL